MKPEWLLPPAFAVPAHAWSQALLARVTDVNDPLSLARVKVEPYPYDTDRDAAIWARVAAPFAGGKRGAFLLPQPGDEVLIVFVGGDPRAPVVVGGLWNGADQPPESIKGKVDRWSFTGKAGTRIAIVEESDATAKVEIKTPAGASLVLTDEGGGKLTVECGGNTITVKPGEVSVQCSGTIKLRASKIDMQAGMLTVDAAMSKFSGVVKCDVLQTNSVISSSYTPGAGNTW
ncbi:MAG TPA: phage baseplate assembly protein V [Solimonas sp.]|nr:phage baseplate assembly protein V [Solimonas sp.]